MAILRIKKFNVAGPCLQAKHYMLPPQSRLPVAQRLVDDEEYFILHAPRQSGKTTSVKSLVNQLNKDGDYYALYCSVEALQRVTQADAGEVMLSLIAKLAT
ncbi:MAG: hypothetical protein LBR53_04885 [Deltaproteobacteria bacterium]|jgi:predicted AAA+ superfamily ATPase|nr:hypothetical protein [Deltaproteobacteria bacterium]